METLVERLDNDVTKLYKFASKNRVPRSLIFIKNDKYVSFFDELVGIQPEDIEQILEEYRDRLGKIDNEDIIMGFYRENLIKSGTEQEKLDQLNNLARQLDPTISSRFYSFLELKKAYQRWDNELKESLEHIKKEVKDIEVVQNELIKFAKSQRLKITSPKISNATLSFQPIFEELAATPQDGMKIFDLMEPSIFAPYIAYRDHLGVLKSKVYKGQKFEQRPNYDTSVLPDSLMLDADHIYVNFWLSNLEDKTLTLQNSPKEFFRKVTYNLVTNILMIETPTEPGSKLLETEEEIIERLATIFPVELGSPNRTKLHGEFSLMYEERRIDDWFDELTLADCLINDDLFTSYLYMEERFTPFTFKKKLNLYYKSIIKTSDQTIEQRINSNYASVEAWYTKRETSKDQSMVFVNPVTNVSKTETYSHPQEYLTFLVINAESTEVLDQFILVFKLMMEYYVSIRDEIKEFFTEHIGVIDIENVKKTANKAKQKKDKNGNLEQLKEQAPDIFVVGYSTACQANAHPLIVTEEEASEFRKKKRQVISFPQTDDPSERKILLTCPNDERPYIGVRENNFEINKGKYPYLPCCYHSDHLNNPNSAWSRYIKGVTFEKTKGAKADKKLVTNKFLSEGNMGFLPKSVDNILKAGSVKDGSFSRFGVPRSPSSLLHCVLSAIGDEVYMSMDEDEKEQYVIAARRWMADNVFDGLVKQQMYDYEKEEIKDYFLEMDQFLDPNYVYRAIEELFELNVYTFASPSPGEDGGTGTFELPRFNHFLCKSHKPERPTLILLRSVGSTSDQLRYPQIELVTELEGNNLSTFFEGDFSNYIFDLSRKVMNIKYTKLSREGIETFNDLLFTVDYSSVFNLAIESQLIDGYGKMRGINVVYKKRISTIMLPPSEPLNVPISNEIYPSNDHSFMKKFEKTKSDDEGDWYALYDEPNALFLPKNDRKNESTTGRIAKLKKTLFVFKQILHWIYGIYYRNTGKSVKNFFDEYVIVDKNYNSDTYTYDLKEKFPSSQNVNDCLAQLTKLSNFSKREKGSKYVLIAYSTEFKEKLKTYLESSYNPEKIVSSLSDFYNDEKNFIQYPNSLIFVNRSELDTFLDLEKGQTNKIRRRIKEKYSRSFEPYTYKDRDGKVYIVQNANGGFEDVALSISHAWVKKKYNPGTNGTLEKIDGYTINKVQYRVNIYALSSDDTIELVKEVDGEGPLLRILYYNTSDNYEKVQGKHAALLEVL